MANRDDFTPATRQRIAERAGFRCSNPTCRRLTTGPDPRSTEGSRRIGRAAHICAASAGGPRFDQSQTASERRHADNGLCAACASVVDDNVDGYPVEALHAWKRRSEAAAAREVAGTDLVLELLGLIDSALERHFEFERAWHDSAPSLLPAWESDSSDDERTQAHRSATHALLRHSAQRPTSYNQDIAPVIAEIITRAERILGPDNATVERAKDVQRDADVNPLAGSELARCVGDLRTELVLE